MIITIKTNNSSMSSAILGFVFWRGFIYRTRLCRFLKPINLSMKDVDIKFVMLTRGRSFIPRARANMLRVRRLVICRARTALYRSLLDTR